MFRYITIVRTAEEAKRVVEYLSQPRMGKSKAIEYEEMTMMTVAMVTR